jgi:hypothetical protein
LRPLNPHRCALPAESERERSQWGTTTCPKRESERVGGECGSCALDGVDLLGPCVICEFGIFSWNLSARGAAPARRGRRGARGPARARVAARGRRRAGRRGGQRVRTVQARRLSRGRVPAGGAAAHVGAGGRGERHGGGDRRAAAREEVQAGHVGAVDGAHAWDRHTQVRVACSSPSIWGGGHRFVVGCQYTVCCCTSSWTVWV